MILAQKCRLGFCQQHSLDMASRDMIRASYCVWGGLMPGIPLLNLGAALGGLSQGWNQARQQGLQQAVQQLALQQAQRQQQAQTLAGLALQAGLFGNNQTQINPLSPMSGPVPGSPSTSGSGSQGNGFLIFSWRLFP
jgi:hypothetical protein